MSVTTITQRATAATPSAESSTVPGAAPLPGTFFERHPILAYYVLAFAISWGGILLVIIGGRSALPATQEQFDRLMPFAIPFMLFGPGIAGIVMTGLVDGKAGYRELLARLLRWRVGARWYMVALLAAPLMYVALTFSLSLTSAEFLPSILVTNDRSALLMMGLAYGLLGGGFLEELGWTGFAVPRLRQRFGAIQTALIVGVLWGAYHFSVIYWSGSHSGALGLAILLAQLFAWLPAYRVLMVWVYDRTQSLLVAMLMHASVTAGMLILQPLGMEGMHLLIWLLVFAAAWWAVVAAVGLAHGGQLAATGPERGGLTAGATSHSPRCQ